MKTRTADVLSLGCIAAATIVAIVLYPDLPEQIPTHWNAAGEIDDYTPKPWGVMILPLIALCTWVVLKIIPAISPKGFRTGGFQGVINVFQVAIVSFLSIVEVLVLLVARGSDVHMEDFISLGVGALFIILGNYLGKVRKNFFIGIRTPWTLASDEVWARTHRLGGWVFTGCGALMIVTSFLPRTPALVIGIIVVAALVPVVYSFIAYRRIEGFEDDGDAG